ncbi:MAG: hypothetical protein FWE60_06215, partial [Oscillospiraceae bacterium]|nr:hypothetical protein [Oscillospiraceae bacterium]
MFVKLYVESTTSSKHFIKTNSSSHLPEKINVGFVYITSENEVKYIEGCDALTQEDKFWGTVKLSLPHPPIATQSTIKEPLYYSWIIKANYENGMVYEYPRAEYSLKAYTNRLKFLVEYIIKN